MNCTVFRKSLLSLALLASVLAVAVERRRSSRIQPWRFPARENGGTTARSR